MTGNDQVGTRERILDAAIDLAKSGERVTVRGVASAAGVGMGTLRHHFGTQRELLDAVLSSIYEAALPDERIRESGVPAGERLRECLGHLLAPVGIDGRAQETWAEIFRTFIDAGTSGETRAGYVELHRQTVRRVESWLAILVEEGALERGDNGARALFLLAVVNGLAIQRALPSPTPPLEVEDTVLSAAIDSLPLTWRP